MVSVDKNGKHLANLTTEKRQYVTSDQPMTEVGIRSTPVEDLYLILSAMDDMNGALNADASAQGIDLQVLVKPLVGWIWYGTLVLTVGSLISMWPSAEKRRVVEEAPSGEPDRGGSGLTWACS